MAITEVTLLQLVSLAVVVPFSACAPQPPRSLADQNQEIQTQVLAYMLDSSSHDGVRVFCLGTVVNGRPGDTAPGVIEALGTAHGTLRVASLCGDAIPRWGHNDTLAALSVSYDLVAETRSLEVRGIDIQGPTWATHYACRLRQGEAWKLQDCRVVGIS